MSTDAMTPPVFRLSIWFSALLLVVPVSSLMCHSCQSTTPLSECESDMREFRKGVNSKFARNCSDYNNMNQEYCAIESYIQNGVVNALIRDCNDGTFSFTFDRYPYKRMDHVNGQSNITVCTYKSGVVQCVSLCDKDMCNGPSTAARLHWTLLHWTLPFLSCLIGSTFRI